ncbi:hypothetical protein CKO51_01575 [Rhodopirellula sp. SM50]|nr:hypothetical protein CKO51_01575 [Rhodopirellula sp. SM50]
MSAPPITRPSLPLRLRDRGNHAAWSEFLQIYEPVIYRLARRRGLQDADARKIVQEVLLRVAALIAVAAMTTTCLGSGTGLPLRSKSNWKTCLATSLTRCTPSKKTRSTGQSRRSRCGATASGLSIE